MLNKSEIISIIMLLVLIVLIVWLGIIFVSADAQLSIESTLEDLQNANKTNCEIVQINEFLYAPVTLELEHEKAITRVPDIKANDPASEPQYEGRSEQFIFETGNFTDDYEIEVIWDYVEPSDAIRQVFYRIFSGEDTSLSYEGNWGSTGNQFCRIFSFNVEHQPKFPTAEEINEANKDSFQLMLEGISGDVGGIGTLTIIQYIISITTAMFIVVILILNWFNIKGIKNSVIEPMRMYQKVAGKIKNIIENIQMISQRIVDDAEDTRNLTKLTLIDIRSTQQDMSLQTGDTHKDKTEIPQAVKVEKSSSGIFGFLKKKPEQKEGKELPLEMHTQEYWEKIYIKQTREENQKLREKLEFEYSEKGTEEIAVKCRALFNVLLKQV